jgi:uncharacterized protein (TIGR03546 family)
MIISWIARVFVAINSNKKSSQIAMAISFAFILALVPKANLLWVSLFILTFFLKLNQAVEMVFIAVFSLLLGFLDKFLDRLGYAILTIPSLGDFFTKLFNSPFFYLTKYYNSIVMGGLVVGLVMAFPIYFLSKYLIGIYRDKAREKVANNKFIQAILQQPLLAGLKKGFGSSVNFYDNLR